MRVLMLPIVTAFLNLVEARPFFVVAQINTSLMAVEHESAKACVRTKTSSFETTTVPPNMILYLRGGETISAATKNNENNPIDSFLNAMDLLGTAVFAFSGALTAGKNGMDLLGTAVVAAVTSCGGGTLRDMALDSGVVFWMKQPVYLQTSLVVTLATFFVWPTLEKRMGWTGSEIPVCLADAVGLAAFAVLGAQKAQTHQLHPLMWVVSGLMSACFGGVIRDVLLLQRPRILYPDRTMYGTAPLIGSAVYTTLVQSSPWKTQLIASIAFGVTFVARVWAFNNPTRLPHWQQNRGSCKKD